MAIESGRELVKAHYRAMQMGPNGEDAIVELFADDAVYLEWLTGGDQMPRAHEGKAAIRAAFRVNIAPGSSISRPLKTSPPPFIAPSAAV